MDFGTFFQLCCSHPWAFVAILLCIGVTFVNGWTDAPNAIAVAVSTRCIKPKTAVILCAIGNIVGVVISGAFAQYIAGISGGDVSQTISKLIDWQALGVDTNQMLMALSCGLFSIVVVSLVCTYFGFPSSQTNCLVGGITGAGIGMTALAGYSNWFAYVGVDAWSRVAVGFFGSLILGFILGFGLTKLIVLLFKKVTRGHARVFFTKGEQVSSIFLSIVHGFQDGAMFIGVMYMVASMLSKETSNPMTTTDLAGTWWIYLPIGIIIAAGTMMGGYNIIKTLGSGVAKLHRYQAFATDLASAIGIFLATCFGLPVSTGSVKQTAIMGGAASKNVHRVRWNTAGKMIFWGFIVFPATALVGFICVLIFKFTV